MTICDWGGGGKIGSFLKKFRSMMSPENCSLRSLMPPKRTLSDLMMPYSTAPSTWEHYTSSQASARAREIQLVKGLQTCLLRNYGLVAISRQPSRQRGKMFNETSPTSKIPCANLAQTGARTHHPCRRTRQFKGRAQRFLSFHF